MPSYVGGTHPLKLLGGMASPPVPPSPPRTDSRASSASPAQPPASRTGFSIADILRPNFGSKEGTEDDYEEEKEVERSAKEKKRTGEQSVFKAEPLKERLKLPLDRVDVVPLKGRLPNGYGNKFPMVPEMKLSGLVAPKPMHGLPNDISPAYYQSYYSLYQQKYADYMQLYGQPGLLPFNLSPTTAQPMKNQLQLAHEQLLANQQLQQNHHQQLQGRLHFPGAVPPMYPSPVPPHPASAARLPHKPVKLDNPHLDPHHQSSPIRHFAQATKELRQSPIAPVVTQRSADHAHPGQVTERSRSPSNKTSGNPASSPRSSPLPSPGEDLERGRSVQSPDSTSRDTSSPQEADKDGLMWPAWVYCTRYSDRPSSGEFTYPYCHTPLGHIGVHTRV